MPTIEVSTKQEVKIAPKLRHKLTTALRNYQDVRDKINALKKKQDGYKAEADAIRDELGEQTISINGYNVTLVVPTRKKFNEKTFVANGGDLQIYQNSFDEVPVKAHTRISCPGDRESGEE